MTSGSSILKNIKRRIEDRGGNANGLSTIADALKRLDELDAAGGGSGGSSGSGIFKVTFKGTYNVPLDEETIVENMPLNMVALAYIHPQNRTITITADKTYAEIAEAYANGQYIVSVFDEFDTEDPSHSQYNFLNFKEVDSDDYGMFFRFDTEISIFDFLFQSNYISHISIMVTDPSTTYDSDPNIYFEAGAMDTTPLLLGGGLLDGRVCLDSPNLSDATSGVLMSLNGGSGSFDRLVEAHRNRQSPIALLVYGYNYNLTDEPRMCKFNVIDTVFNDTLAGVENWSVTFRVASGYHEEGRICVKEFRILYDGSVVATGNNQYIYFGGN